MPMRPETSMMMMVVVVVVSVVNKAGSVIN
jgi:hypothetical protein